MQNGTHGSEHHKHIYQIGPGSHAKRYPWIRTSQTYIPNRAGVACKTVPMDQNITNIPNRAGVACKTVPMHCTACAACHLVLTKISSRMGYSKYSNIESSIIMNISKNPFLNSCTLPVFSDLALCIFQGQKLV